MEFVKLKEMKEQGLEIGKREVKVNNYLGLAEKMILIEGLTNEDGTIVNGLVGNVTKEENGLLKIDRYLYEIWTCFEICRNYGDIVFENDEFGVLEYNFIMQNGMLDYIKENSNDVYTFLEILNNVISDKISSYNSLSGTITRSVDKVLNTLTDLTNETKMNSMLETLGKTISGNDTLKEIFKDYTNAPKSNDVLSNILKVVEKVKETPTTEK